MSTKRIGSEIDLPIILQAVLDRDLQHVSPVWIKVNHPKSMLFMMRKNLLALIVGPGNWPLTAIILRGVPSGANVVFVISRVYYQSYDYYFKRFPPHIPIQSSL
jgi:hypothetical protein